MKVTVKGLVKNYNNLEAVKGIDFEINEGEFLALLGQNGAGKSTTISILSTLLSKTKGNVTYGDLVLGQDDDEIRKLIGIVFQNNCLDDKLTVLENLKLKGSLYNYDKETLNSKIENIIKTFELDNLLNQQYRNLSGGQRRRVDIARALLHDPKILYLDEPTTGLDPSTRKLVWKILKKLRKEGLTILLTTHYMEETLDCDRVIIIHSGKLIATDTPEKLRLKYSNDKLKLMGDIKVLKEKLSNIEYEINNDLFEIKLKDSLEALSILNKVKYHINGFEVIRGSMDDVFLNLTGRRLN